MVTSHHQRVAEDKKIEAFRSQILPFLPLKYVQCEKEMCFSWMDASREHVFLQQ